MRDKTLAELQALDIGYGYTADGGKTFPFRGRRKDGICRASRRRWRPCPTRRSCSTSRAGSARGRPAGRRATAARRTSSSGAIRLLRRARGRSTDRAALSPRRWAFTKDSAKACTKAYRPVRLDLDRARMLPRRHRDRAPLELPMDVLGLAQPADPADGRGRRPRDRRSALATAKLAPASTCPSSSARSRRPSTAISGSRTSGRSGRRCGPAAISGRSRRSTRPRPG